MALNKMDNSYLFRLEYQPETDIFQLTVTPVIIKKILNSLEFVEIGIGS